MKTHKSLSPPCVRRKQELLIFAWSFYLLFKKNAICWKEFTKSVGLMQPLETAGSKPESSAFTIIFYFLFTVVIRPQVMR